MSIKKLFIALSLTALTAPVGNALDASYYAKSSRLAEGGHWVKIKVTETGVHRLSHDQLRSWGFADPAAVRVYGFSGSELYANNFSTSLPDDLPEIYSEHVADGLVFYGEGDIRLRLRGIAADDVVRRRNHYATYTCYFLSDVPNSSQLAKPLPFVELDNSASSHVAIDYIEPEEYKPSQGGVMWFSNPLLDGESRTYTFHAEDFLGEGIINYVPVTSSPSNLTIPIEVNENKATPIKTSYKSVYHTGGDQTYLVFNSIPLPSKVTVNLLEGNTDFDFTISGNANANWVAIDYAALLYTRRNRLADYGQIQMHFTTLRSTNVKVTEAGPDTRVWDVTNPLNVTPMEFEHYETDNSISSMTVDGQLVTMVAFDPVSPKLLVPQYVETVTNPANLHGEDADFDMVILTNPTFMPAANRLAALHTTHQNFNVKVVDVHDIYNEFSSGTPSAIALRRYLKMLYDRNPGRLKYAMIIGVATNDHRHLNVADDGNYVFTYEVEEDREIGYTGWTNYEVTNFCSDNYFGMFSDDFSIRDFPSEQCHISVGRLSAGGLSQANQMIDKIEAYFNTYLTDDYSSRVAILSGQGDDNAHLLMSESGLQELLKGKPDIMPYRGYSALFRESSNSTENDRLLQNFVVEAMSSGVHLASFCGHSNAGEIDCGLSIPMLDKIKFINHPIFFMATCGENPYDIPNNYLGPKLMTLPEGCVSLIGASRTVYLNRNKALYEQFLNDYGSAAAGDCLGDIWIRSYNFVTKEFESTYGLNTACYNLAGDPALPLPHASRKVSVTKINGVAASTPVESEAFKPIELEGTITNAGGNIDTNFNGKIVLSLYEGEKIVQTKAVANVDSSTDVPIAHNLLARTSAEVVNGRWKASMVPPIPLENNAVNQLQLWATNGSDCMALSSTRSVVVTQPSNMSGQTADTEGPVISALYINDPSFCDGDAVDNNFKVCAFIEADPYGLNVSSNSVGGRTIITLDDKEANANVSNNIKWNADGSAEFSFPFTNVNDGNHTLTLSVADNLGNISTRSLSFVVVNSSLTGKLTASKHIVTKNVVIDAVLPASAEVTRISVEDSKHNTVETISTRSFPFNWTPKSSLPDGSYTIRAYLTNGFKWGTTEPLSVILIRH